jgi:hypothetical protein
MTLTLWVLGALFVLLIVYDIVAVLLFGMDATISVSLYEFSRAYPVAAFIAGFLMGHIFFPIYPDGK